MKPIVGSVDLISRTTEGIRNTTTILDKSAERSRPPRSIGEDKALSVQISSMLLNFRRIQSLSLKVYSYSTTFQKERIERKFINIMKN